MLAVSRMHRWCKQLLSSLPTLHKSFLGFVSHAYRDVMWNLQSKRNLKCPTARRLGETSYYANILVFRVLLTVAPKVYTGQSCFTPFGCKRFWRPGAHHLDHAVVNISFRLREDRQLDEHAGSRMVQSTLHNGILATAELEPHYSCHSRATAGLKRAASENCYFPQPSSWGLQLSMTTRLCFLRSLFKPSIICWYCQYCIDFFWRLNIQTTGCLLATGLGFFAHVRPLAVT